MNENFYLVKVFLLTFAVAIVFSGTIGCGKPGSALNWYPKAEKMEGKVTSTLEHEVVVDKFDLNDTVVIKGDGKSSSRRWWVDVNCDYWARCFMRCEGSKQQCLKLAEDSKFTVNSIAPF